MKNFGKTLRRLREEAGYTTPRAFYRERGGRAFFRCTYRQYSNVETGRSKPSPALFEKIGAGLRLNPDEKRSQELVTAFLQATLGSQSLFNFVQRTFSKGTRPAIDADSPLNRALSQTAKARAHTLTKEQTDLITGSLEGHWVFAILTNDNGLWDAQEIAAVTGFSIPKIRSVLKKFEKTGLLRSDAKGKYGCDLRDKDLYLAGDSFSPIKMEELQKHFKKLSTKHGGDRIVKFTNLRASEAELLSYLPELVEPAHKGLGIYSKSAKGSDTAFFQVATVVHKLLTF
ncbi:MAG: hypothetical protein COB53_01200 [Elusimicrobia bacterium]|nr:MAG: hypothetical protein COB53_01200 [Elusimicrobiota bacterium]